MDLALNNLQRLICFKTQPTNHVEWNTVIFLAECNSRQSPAHLKSGISFSSICYPTKAKEISQPYYLPITGKE